MKFFKRKPALPSWDEQRREAMERQRRYADFFYKSKDWFNFVRVANNIDIGLSELSVVTVGKDMSILVEKFGIVIDVRFYPPASINNGYRYVLQYRNAKTGERIARFITPHQLDDLALKDAVLGIIISYFKQ